MISNQLQQTALHYHRNGQLQQAEACYRQILQAQPDHAETLHLLGVLCYQTDRNDEAETLIAKALQRSPRNADYLSNYGLALRANGKLDAAIQAYQKSLQLAPKDMDVQLNLGNAYHEAGRFEEAAGCYRRVYRFNQDTEVRDALCSALQALGNQCQKAGQYPQAEACYQEALQYNSRDAVSHFNLGNAQREIGKPAAAEASYRQAIRLAPNDADAYNNLGNVLREQGQLAEAIAAYETAIKLNPQLYHAKVHLVHQKQHACDWKGLDTDVNEIRHWVQHKPEAQISPFAFLAMPGTSAREQRACAENWLQNRYQPLLAQTGKYSFIKTDKNKLRIGYLSADFRLHPLAYLISELIELHDGEQFEVYAYSYGPDDQSAERTRLRHAFDHFVDIRNLSLQQAADRIHADGIDILIDLTGFTQSSRSNIVALRPAPVLVNWLGYPGTMGKGLFDYLISDTVITPPESASDYGEQLVLLPNAYQPNDRKRPIGKTPARVDYGLPEDAFVFCCFNQTFKILPHVFDSWMRILRQTPDSILWLLECNPLAKNNLLQEAANRGISAERIVFAPRVSMADHMARHVLADLFLDTAPYNAHTTTSDALWMCLPVMTVKGTTFPARVAASLLLATNLPELVVSNLDEYEALALRLARSPQLLESYRERLQQNSEMLPLFNMQMFRQHLENAYWQMWRRWQQGLAPALIQVQQQE